MFLPLPFGWTRLQHLSQIIGQQKPPFPFQARFGSAVLMLLLCRCKETVQTRAYRPKCWAPLYMEVTRYTLEEC
jgi:hypothetical protein